MSEGADSAARSFAAFLAGQAMEQAFYRPTDTPNLFVKQEMGSVSILQFIFHEEDFILNDRAAPDYRVLYTVCCFLDRMTEAELADLKRQQEKSRDLGLILDLVLIDVEEGRYTNLTGGRLTDRKLEKVLSQAMSSGSVQRADAARRASPVVRSLPWNSPFMILIFINVFVFAIDFFLKQSAYDPLMAWGILDGELVRQGQWWRLITAMFLHADTAHLFGNMYFLFMLGRVLYGRYSDGKVLCVYFGSGLAGTLLSSFFLDARSLGASGAIMGLGGVLICQLLFDKNRAYLRNAAVYGNLAILVIFNLAYGLINTGIDNYGHFGGFLCGFLLELIFFRKKA